MEWSRLKTKTIHHAVMLNQMARGLHTEECLSRAGFKSQIESHLLDAGQFMLEELLPAINSLLTTKEAEIVVLPTVAEQNAARVERERKEAEQQVLSALATGIQAVLNRAAAKRQITEA